MLNQQLKTQLHKLVTDGGLKGNNSSDVFFFKIITCAVQGSGVSPGDLFNVCWASSVLNK